ncbi:MAG: NYN domain-containing protein [Candidatus Eisenbacteria bacterium]|uniref:NYN domain-containing protein n=1 Tax=Eiseniibacteriota bacterium TaxID=2212470 RepID=A0A937XAW1_UNCEI|nr:NYN domain-containing protein [Candidatus Eisenbacteria bacterium]
MRPSDEAKLALFIDFDNIALGARDAGQKLRIDLLLQRLLEKGKLVVKRAYADWSHYPDFVGDLHEAAIELIEIPAARRSGKNSADIRLAIDAIELCHAKEHIDTFVIVSGDSDFSPLVSKLRENDKAVIGMGMRNSSAHLLIANCDEYIFYDDLAQERRAAAAAPLEAVPENKRQVFDFLLGTIRALLREGRDTLYSSLIKDTMKRKRPDFDESRSGYATFGDLLEDAQGHGLIEVTRDEKASRTWVVKGIATRSRRGKSTRPPAPVAEASAAAVKPPRERPPARSRRGTEGRARRRPRRPAAPPEA